MGFPCLPKGRRHYIPQRCPFPTQMLAVWEVTHLNLLSESVAGLVGLPVGHATLMGGTHCHPWCGEPKEASLENLCLFSDPRQLNVRPLQAKSTLHPLLPNVSPVICFSTTIHPIRMFDSSLCCWLWLMPKHCSIGQRNLDHQSTWITTLWWWMLWNQCSMWRSMSPSTNETSFDPTHHNSHWKHRVKLCWGLGSHMMPPPYCSDLHPRRRPHWSNLLPCLLWMMWGILCLAFQTLSWRGCYSPFNQTWRGSPRGLVNWSDQ